MNVLIAGGFWAIAKFMVLLCCTIISMIKAIYFYIKTCKKWKRLTKTLYVMTMYHCLRAQSLRWEGFLI